MSTFINNKFCPYFPFISWSYSVRSIEDIFFGEGDILFVKWKYNFCSSSVMNMFISFFISEYTFALDNKLLKSFFDKVLKRLYFLRGQCVILHIGHILEQASLSEIKNISV